MSFNQPTHKSFAVTQRGMTLLEILLSLGVLAGSLAVIANLSRLSTNSAIAARDTTQAQFLCESVMSRLMSGVIEFESVFDQPVYDPVTDFDGVGTSYSNYQSYGADYTWTYSIEINTLDDYGLLEVIVTVEQYLPDSAREPVTCRLVRWMLDKAMAKDALESEAAASENDSASESGSTNRNSSGGNNAGNTGGNSNRNTGGGNSSSNTGGGNSGNTGGNGNSNTGGGNSGNTGGNSSSTRGGNNTGGGNTRTGGNTGSEG